MKLNEKDGFAAYEADGDIFPWNIYHRGNYTAVDVMEQFLVFRFCIFYDYGFNGLRLSVLLYAVQMYKKYTNQLLLFSGMPSQKLFVLRLS
jgi:hypothetical protein